MNEETLFHAALARSSLAERAAFLDGACEGKPDLREAVERLLEAHEASEPFLDVPANTDATIDSAHEGPATEATGIHTPRPDGEPAPGTVTVEFLSDAKPNFLIAGRYTLQVKIGEGGMGEVWVAKQSEPVKRKVALKLIKQGMDSRAVLQRFEQERQALAMMDHPNIAKVLDAGLTPNGQPFFVMELVNGLPLNKFCDEARLTTKDRLELFVNICQAVQHAHQKGIVHRDLKPANILITIIDGKPVPKVIDFGVAKATAGKLTDESLSTQFGAIVGTLEYMSPEQAGFSGEDIDTRADIYSLGVILYELLTGLRPIDARRLRKAALTEMIRIIQQEEPSKPSTRLSTDEALPSMAALRQIEPRKLMALLRGELDWVVMKCLEKHRDRRYETANALSRDIQRYLDGDAVEACPPSVGYRLGKFVNRHRGQVIAAGLLLLALVGGIIGTSYGLFRADRARRAEVKQRLVAEAEKRKAETSEELARQQRARAEEREQQAIDAVKRFRDAVADEPELKDSPRLEALRKTLLKEPLAFFKVLRDRLQADHDTRHESLERLAQVGFDLGHLTDEIGDRRDALIAYRECLAIFRKLADEHPAVTPYRSGLAKSHVYIGILLRATGKPAEALTAIESARAIFQELADAHPSVTNYQAGLASSYINIGHLREDTGKPAEALEAFESARAIFQKLADEHPAVTDYRCDLGGSHNEIGNLLRATGKPAGAMKAHESALAIRRKLADESPAVTQYRSEVAMSHHNIGLLLSETGKRAEALESFELARAIYQKLADEHPAVTEYRSGLAKSHFNIGGQLRATGKPAEAMEAQESARAIFQRLADEHPSVTRYQRVLAASHDIIGNLLREAGKPDEAMKAQESARAIFQKLADEHPSVTLYQSDLAACFRSIGHLLRSTGKTAELLKAHESELAIRQKLAREQPGSPDLASDLGAVLNNIAMVDLDARRFDAARTRLMQAIEWQRKAVAANPAKPQYRQYLTNHLNNLLAAARGLGDAEGEAEAMKELAMLRDSDPAMVALDARLSAILHGDQAPKDQAERLRLAQRAYDKALHCAAARLLGEALAADPELGDDRRIPHRYNAACAAALAGCGKGKDDPAPDETAKAKLRQQALDWLNAELVVWSKIAESGAPQAKPVIVQTLKHWQEDTDLAGIRDTQELAKLPEAERKSWQALWADVDALLAKIARK